jgi:hypothetical protein
MKSKLNYIMIVLYVTILFLGFPGMRDYMSLLYAGYVLLSAAMLFVAFHVTTQDPITTQNPVVILMPYLFITFGLAFTFRDPDQLFLLDIGYLFVTLATAIYFEMRMGNAILLLSIVSYGIIYHTVDVASQPFLQDLLKLGILLIATHIMLYLPAVRRRMEA